MKYIKKILFIWVLIFAVSCADQLDVINPNEPTTDVLNEEAGIKRLALGIYFNGIDINYLWLVQGYHEVMGDAIYIPWGNFAWRWANQPTSITLSDGTVVNPPQGGSQEQELTIRNTRAFGDENAFYHEWFTMYNVNNVANLILQTLDAGIDFAGSEADQNTKAGALTAWARWWKGFAYSRLGSIYSAGIINDEFNETNNDYVSSEALISEANAQFDLAIQALNGLSDNQAYEEVLLAAIPTTTNEGGTGYPTPEEWIRNINTMKARNLLVNTKRDEMTEADWNQIISLADDGIQEGDFTFVMKQDDNNFLFTGWLPPRFFMGWHFPSERLVQDYKSGDERLDRNFVLRSDVRVNQSSRGIQYGTRYNFVDIEDGGDIVSETPGLAELELAGSYEENELMKSEALIFTNQVEEGLAIIDDIRDFQDANLPSVEGAGLTFDEAVEELRIERRVALLLRGLAFYDARRWGVTEPVSDGGGRTGAIVLVPTDAGFDVDTDATFNYNYMDYWGVPDNEIVFNAPSEMSVDIAPR